MLLGGIGILGLVGLTRSREAAKGNAESSGLAFVVFGLRIGYGMDRMNRGVGGLG